jgi:hypothetical protein
MPGFGRFKLTDALPDQESEIAPAQYQSESSAPSPTGKAKSRSKGRTRSAGAKGKPSTDSALAGEQIREARENNEAKNAEGSIRDRMVDIGRGNQQAGRQRAK